MKEYRTKEQQRAFYKSRDWQAIRQKVLERDNHECQWCKEQGRVTNRSHATLEVDHEKELEFHPELALDTENLRTLCRDCHNKRHNRFNYDSQVKEIKWNDEKW